MNRAVLITGAATRIGRVIAEGLASDGWAVIVHYNRSRDNAQSVLEAIKKSGGTAISVQANLNVPFELNSLIDKARLELGRPLTALINNASVFNADLATDFTPALLDHHLNINLNAPLVLTQHFAAQLQENEVGAVINMIDQRVLKPAPSYFTYSMSKSALYWATKTMAQSFAPQIRVNGIGPGPTLKNHMQTTAEFEAEAGSTLLGAGSPPETILDGVRYLLTAQSVTGQMLAIDGGQHLS